MTERTIVLPTRDNSGKSLRGQLATIHAEILAIAGGYSETKQVGYWRDAETGQVYRDEALRLTTTVDDAQDRALAERLPVWCAALKQVCLYTHTASVNADFVYPVNQESVSVA